MWINVCKDKLQTRYIFQNVPYFHCDFSLFLHSIDMKYLSLAKSLNNWIIVINFTTAAKNNRKFVEIWVKRKLCDCRVRVGGCSLIVVVWTQFNCKQSNTKLLVHKYWQKFRFAARCGPAAASQAASILFGLLKSIFYYSVFCCSNFKSLNVRWLCAVARSEIRISLLQCSFQCVPVLLWWDAKPEAGQEVPCSTKN